MKDINKILINLKVNKYLIKEFNYKNKITKINIIVIQRIIKENSKKKINIKAITNNISNNNLQILVSNKIEVNIKTINKIVKHFFIINKKFFSNIKINQKIC